MGFIVKRILAERRQYRDLCSWLLNLDSRLLRRFPRMPLPGRGKIIAVAVANTGTPLAVRLATSDMFVAIEIFALGEYASVVQNLPDVKAILDLGSNVGMSIRYWREQYPTAIIVGVEPDRDNARLCRKNARVSGSTRGQTHLIRGCAGGSARNVTLNRSLDAYAFSIGESAATNDKSADIVKVYTVPQLLCLAGVGGKIDLLKCDIEGGERELFERCHEWIQRVENMVVEVHPPYTLDDLVRSLSDNGASFELLENVDKGGGLRVGFLRRRQTHEPHLLSS